VPKEESAARTGRPAARKASATSKTRTGASSNPRRASSGDKRVPAPRRSRTVTRKSTTGAPGKASGRTAKARRGRSEAAPLGLDAPSPVEPVLAEASEEDLVDALEAVAEGGIRITFAGKANARRLARLVRPRTTTPVPRFSFGSAEDQSANLVIEGDNLQAMTTLYKLRGQVDLIVTDPPYNTGTDFRYNDKWDDDPNDPGLGDFVSEDDGARHTKWMKFMWPRLQLMKAMLKPNGVLAICIDHRELFRLGQMLDELFKDRRRLAIINWQKAVATKSDKKHVSTSTEYVLVYAKDEELARTGLLDRDNSRYSNPDDDPKDEWREGNLTARTWAEKDDYAIQSPFTGELHDPAGGGAWRHPKRNVKAWLEEWGVSYVEVDLGDGRPTALMVKNGTPGSVPASARRAAQSVLARGQWPFIWFGRDGQGRPRTKTYLYAVKQGRVPTTWWEDDPEDEVSPIQLEAISWAHEQSGRSSDGVNELTAVVGPGHGFETVKPLKLISKIIQLWCPPNGLVVDPFAGSGTTAHAILAMNAELEASRRFVMIEQGRPERGDSYARTLLAERLKRVLKGNWASGKQPPLPGGFSFVSLGKRVDAAALLRMEREEMVDTVIASHFDANHRRGDQLVRVERERRPYRYLVARNSDNEGFFLVWDGPEKNTNLTEAVYNSCAREADDAGLKPGSYNIYARLYVFQTEGIRFLQIPDRILADFGLDVRSEPFSDDDL